MGLLDNLGLGSSGSNPTNQPQYVLKNPWQNVKSDPNQDIIDAYLSGQQDVTVGGSAATFFDRAAAEAAARQQYNTMRANVSGVYNKQRDTATGRKDTTNTELNKLYTQLAAAYEPLAGQTAERYKTATEVGQKGSADIVARAQDRINQEAAARAAAYAEMGIAGPDAGQLTGSAEIAQRGINDINNVAANWAGLMGAQGAAEQGRNKLDYTGAQDSGTMAQQDVTNMYNRFLESLALQEAQQMAEIGNQEAAQIAQIMQTPEWSGGSAGTTKTINTSGIDESIYNEAMKRALGMSNLDNQIALYEYKRANPAAQSGTTYTAPRSRGRLG